MSAAAWGQGAPRPVAVQGAYVAIVPAGATDVDFVIALQRGIDLVLCQSGVKPRSEGPASASELKLAASLIKAEFEPDQKKREIVRECELTEAAATLPGGVKRALPDVSLAGRSALRGNVRDAGESFFVTCGVLFARGALDALKNEITIRPSSCDKKP